MAIKGEIIRWDMEKGFGFIQPHSGGRQIFVHISDFKDRTHPPEIKQQVTFKRSTDKQGRSYAQKVTRKNDKYSKGFYLWVLTFLFWGLLIGGLYYVQAPVFVFWLYGGMSVITFIVYSWDKFSAKMGRWRTSEKTLHRLAFFCGWPGALLAQAVLRHKSQKKTFRRFFWVTLWFNTGLILSGIYFLPKEHLTVVDIFISGLFEGVKLLLMYEFSGR